METQDIRDEIRQAESDLRDVRHAAMLGDENSAEESDIASRLERTKRMLETAMRDEEFREYMEAQSAAAARYAQALRMDPEAGARQYAESKYSAKFREAWAK
jgi:hypothetical protein